ncbi:hypothetical protein [Micromonospora profundi]|uniref:hypothetical protein n=1 Tax=Micromonospora profundi TaxID=1420889 RepID=UPI00364A2182
MLAPNAVLPCGTESARRRHAAHGQNCRACFYVPADQDADLAVSVRRLQRRVASVETTNARLRRQVAELADWARLLDDNNTMADRLANVEKELAELLRSGFVSRDAVDRAYRRIFPTSRQEVAA